MSVVVVDTLGPVPPEVGGAEMPSVVVSVVATGEEVVVASAVVVVVVWRGPALTAGERVLSVSTIPLSGTESDAWPQAAASRAMPPATATTAPRAVLPRRSALTTTDWYPSHNERHLSHSLDARRPSRVSGLYAHAPWSLWHALRMITGR
jgi:hypothetical protein